MPIANAYARVTAEQSIADIQKRLTRAGATRVIIDYRDGIPVALSFGLPMHEQLVGFRLPAKPEPIQAVLKRQQRGTSVSASPEQARKVAWAIVRDWVRAQLALVEAEQATLSEVMLPYMLTAGERTLYQELEARGPQMLALGGPP